MRIIVGLIAALAATAELVVSAYAHGEADWINQGGYRNAVGELCCGGRACAALADDDVEGTARGFHVRSLDETVPFGQALRSPDGRYWRCAWGSERKCFFAPPIGF